MSQAPAVPDIAIESYPLRRYLLDRARGKAREYVPFYYEIAIQITALATDTVGSVTLDTDAPFLLMHCQSEVVNNALVPFSTAGIIQGTALLRIGGPGSRAVSRSPVALGNMYPQRGGAFTFPACMPMEAGSMLHLTINLQSIVAANPLPYAFRFQHMGLKVYGWGS